MLPTPTTPTRNAKLATSFPVVGETVVFPSRYAAPDGSPFGPSSTGSRSLPTGPASASPGKAPAHTLVPPASVCLFRPHLDRVRVRLCAPHVPEPGPAPLKPPAGPAPSAGGAPPPAGPAAPPWPAAPPPGATRLTAPRPSP